MRKQVIILLMLAVMPAMVFGQRRSSSFTPEDYHFFYVSGSAGFHSLDQNVSVTTPQGSARMLSLGGWGALGGIGYEFRIASFWLSVGAQYQHVHSWSRADQFQYMNDSRDPNDQTSTWGLDTQNKPALFSYRVDQEEQTDWNFGEVPLMVGYYLRGFYIGAGAKIGFPFSTSGSTKGSYGLSAYYPEFYGHFENMEEHAYGNYEFSSTMETKMEPQWSILGEVGYDVLSHVGTRADICHVLKVGAYFEYGLNTAVRVSDPSRHIVLFPNENEQTSNATEVQFNPYYSSGVKQGDRIVPYYVGVKLTYMIGGSSRGGSGTFHHGCKCYEM